MVSTATSSSYLETAKTISPKRDWKAADAALAGVQDGVEMESVQSDMPLAHARENLILARDAVQNSHFTEARDALRAASKALITYSNENTAHKQLSKNLRHQRNELAADIQRNHADGGKNKRLVEYHKRVVSVPEGAILC